MENGVLMESTTALVSLSVHKVKRKPMNMIVRSAKRLERALSRGSCGGSGKDVEL